MNVDPKARLSGGTVPSCGLRPLVVLKFGGTSVGSIARIHHVAALAMGEQRRGNDVVVIVSAMSGETNRLLALANDVSEHADQRERDSLAACGEQASAALTAIAIQAAGGKARSFLAHQIRVLTDANYGDARITGVESAALRVSIDRGEIPVIAGFQGVDSHGNLTTLGRGGSDTTAVAVAAALKATTCDIYTDVDGVYTADPNIVPSARKLARVPYQHMLTFASLGAKVLHDRSVELAKEFGVVIHVRTSFGDTPGTMISSDDERDEGTVVGGLALERKLVRAYVRTGDASAASQALSTALLDSGIMVGDSFSSEGRLSFILRTLDVSGLRKILSKGSCPLVCIEDVARISLVGTGLMRDSRIQTKATHLVQGLGIKVLHVVTADTHISLFTAPETADEVMRILHDGMAIGVGGEHGENTRPPGRRR